jgi:hypothetical protein
MISFMISVVPPKLGAGRRFSDLTHTPGGGGAHRLTPVETPSGGGI